MVYIAAVKLCRLLLAIAVFTLSLHEKEKIGVYCWLNTSDCYLVRCSESRVETSPAVSPDSKLTTSEGKHETLRGHVVAYVASTAFGAGLGPEWVTFVFMAEGVAGKAAPVRIAYAFYNTDQLPPDSFWDYEVHYKLDVKRDQKCDTTVQAISYEKATDENGQALAPLRVLQPAKSAPTDLLKPETPLPCYVLRYGQYRRLNSPGRN